MKKKYVKATMDVELIVGEQPLMAASGEEEPASAAPNIWGGEFGYVPGGESEGSWKA